MARKRNRNSESGQGRKGRPTERVRNRSGYEFMPDFMPERSRSSDERSSGEKRNSGDSDSSASRSNRRSS
jgi:hypothetical protein